MRISYKWLSRYLPEKIEPERLSRILTSVGLEVEKTENYEEIPGSLKGLVIGEVLEVQPHPSADRLTLARVNTGNGELQIVCGAPNILQGQKVIVAPVGATIYPQQGESVTMKVAKIRGVESHGMICAEDEIGLGTSHEGIMVLPGEARTGQSATDYFKPYTDIIFTIGLTPNRMDAMSHLGVARDICAWLTHHEKKDVVPVYPKAAFRPDNKSKPVSITIASPGACKRYCGITIEGITVGPSPQWMQESLRAIGVRPVNNIVDITNYVLHETGQPLHAFDYDRIAGPQIIVRNAKAGSVFVTLDGKERKLHSDDLMICDAADCLCIAGVFGGTASAVTSETRNIFLESAWFDPVHIRRTSFRHGLRTDAAIRFEKGADISAAGDAAKHAAMMIREIAGGAIASELVDIYPDPDPKKQVTIKYHYLKKTSGKNYHPDAVKKILTSLGFTVERDQMDALTVAVPYHKPDIAHAADLVEEIMRIDGLDNIPLPATMTISPSPDPGIREELLKEKIASVLTGIGFTEILTNSITNSAFLDDTEKSIAVKLINNLSSELDVMRPAMIHTGLGVISFNHNRKNEDLKLFEFGKTYRSEGRGKYDESNHLAIFVTGSLQEMHWKGGSSPADFYYIKGVVEMLMKLCGIPASYRESGEYQLVAGMTANAGKSVLAQFGTVNPALASRFDIKQPVLFADIHWDEVLQASDLTAAFREISRFPVVERDLAIVIPREMKYAEIHDHISSLRLNRIRDIRLFDVFSGEKLGKDKKSLAVSITFQDENKTLTDSEIDSWMNRIMGSLEKNLGAEIRKS